MYGATLRMPTLKNGTYKFALKPNKNFTINTAKLQQTYGNTARNVNIKNIAKLTPPTNDGGYDISLTRGGEKTIVECKCYSIGHKVGRPNIQKLVGANNVVLADKMIFITTSDFSGAAISYAEEVEVKLINGNKLMELLHKQGFIEKEKVKINVMECQLETADLYPYVPRDIYESFFE